jgi:hypothetical protein
LLPHKCQIQLSQFLAFGKVHRFCWPVETVAKPALPAQFKLFLVSHNNSEFLTTSKGKICVSTRSAFPRHSHPFPFLCTADICSYINLPYTISAPVRKGDNSVIRIESINLGTFWAALVLGYFEKFVNFVIVNLTRCWHSGHA